MYKADFNQKSRQTLDNPPFFFYIYHQMPFLTNITPPFRPCYAGSLFDISSAV
ncbi:MAG: hypothetical protein LBQ76_03690 [Candidatus Fibromonas sp.]|nr:hypothetical protein [Candidatus Fibromonas sp.]